MTPTPSAYKIPRIWDPHDVWLRELSYDEVRIIEAEIRVKNWQAHWKALREAREMYDVQAAARAG